MCLVRHHDINNNNTQGAEELKCVYQQLYNILFNCDMQVMQTSVMRVEREKSIPVYRKRSSSIHLRMLLNDRENFIRQEIKSKYLDGGDNVCRQNTSFDT